VPSASQLPFDRVTDQHSYPQRPEYWAFEFLRTLENREAAHQITAQGCWLLTLVVRREAWLGYREAPRIFLRELARLSGVEERQMARLVDRLVAAGWLHWHKVGPRHAATCWVTVPDCYQSPTTGNEPPPHSSYRSSMTGKTTTKETGNVTAKKTAKTTGLLNSSLSSHTSSVVPPEADESSLAVGSAQPLAERGDDDGVSAGSEEVPDTPAASKLRAALKAAGVTNAQQTARRALQRHSVAAALQIVDHWQRKARFGRQAGILVWRLCTAELDTPLTGGWGPQDEEQAVKELQAQQAQEDQAKRDAERQRAKAAKTAAAESRQGTTAPSASGPTWPEAVERRESASRSERPAPLTTKPMLSSSSPSSSPPVPAVKLTQLELDFDQLTAREVLQLAIDGGLPEFTVSRIRSWGDRAKDSPLVRSTLLELFAAKRESN
jgi:hypothetical protein